MDRKLISVLLILFIIMLSLCSCDKKIKTLKKLDENMIALENFLLIDGTGAAPIKDKVILIKEDKIIKVCDKKDVEIPENCKEVDLKGNTLLPGFINAHVHNAYDEKRLQNWLKSGVTTVRDMSARNVSDYVQKRDGFNMNPQNTHLVSANPILKPPGGYGWISVDTPEAAKVTVNKLIDSNVDIIKFALEDDLQGSKWPIFSPEMAKAIVDTAHARNKRVLVHISHTRNLQEAISAGVDEVAHMVIENLDDSIIEEMVKKDIYFIPTMELWHNCTGSHKFDETVMDNTLRFYKAGGKIAFGTDYAGYSCSFDQSFPITEAKLMQQAGIPNMDIIVSGTKNAAFVCGLDKVLGTIEEGKQADILVVEGNPMEDIGVLSKTQMVIHEGEIVFDKASDSQK